MTADIESIDSEALGSQSTERYSDAAIGDAQSLADAVNGDPVLATRIMGVANSTYFRGVTEVPNVREALMRMGVREARTIVVVVALRSTVLRSPGLGDYARELWRHSILSALVTQEITSELPPWQSTGFLAGLLHDLGKLVVLAFVSELPAWQEDGAEPSQSTIDAINDATHASLGAMVLDSWGFPQRFCDAIMAHEHSEEAAEDVASLAAAVELGHHLARQIDAGWPDDSEDLQAQTLSVAERLGLNRRRLTAIANEAEAGFETLSKLS